MLSSTFLLLSLISSSYGAIFVTNPVATTTMTAGQQATISWEDDGTSPSLSSFGTAEVSIYAGNALQQTQLQQIVASVDVGTTSSLQFTPLATIGPNSAEYFIRFESLVLNDTTTPQYHALAFSSKFTMAGMTGTFSADVQSQIDGQSTAPIAGATSAASGSSGSVAASTTASATSKSTSASKSASVTGAAASPSSSNAAVSSNLKTWGGIVSSVIVGAFVL